MMLQRWLDGTSRQEQWTTLFKSKLDIVNALEAVEALKGLEEDMNTYWVTQDSTV